MENLLEEEANQGGEKKRKKERKRKKSKNLHPLGGVIVAKRARRNLVDRSPRCLPSWQCSSSVHYRMAFTEHRSIIYYSYSSDPQVQRWNWTCRRSKTRSSKQTRYSHDRSRHLCGAMQRLNARNTRRGRKKEKKKFRTHALARSLARNRVAPDAFLPSLRERGNTRNDGNKGQAWNWIIQYIAKWLIGVFYVTYNPSFHKFACWNIFTNSLLFSLGEWGCSQCCLLLLDSFPSNRWIYAWSFHTLNQMCPCILAHSKTKVKHHWALYNCFWNILPLSNNKFHRIDCMYSLHSYFSYACFS